MSGSGWSAAELARVFSVSRTTAYEDKADVKEPTSDGFVTPGRPAALSDEQAAA